MNGTRVLLPGGGELVLLVLHLAIVGCTAALAARRGRSPLVWGALAFVASVLATAVLLLRSRKVHV
jgi:hypothetical protein